MTTLIELTLPACTVYPKERRVLVNPANITQISEGLEDDEGTYVEMNSGTTRIVKEKPDEIYEAIYKAEHPEYSRCIQNESK